MATRIRDARTVRLPDGLARTGDNRMVAGVAGGLGRYLGVDPTAIRLALVVLETLTDSAAVARA